MPIIIKDRAHIVVEPSSRTLVLETNGLSTVDNLSRVIAPHIRNRWRHKVAKQSPHYLLDRLTKSSCRSFIDNFHNEIRVKQYNHIICSPLADAAELTVRIDNPPPDGTVAFALFDSANAFGDLRDAEMVVKQHLDGRDEYLIKDIPPGEYALLVYYDENTNDRIDKNFIGIPKEPLGFSNRYRPT